MDIRNEKYGPKSAQMLDWYLPEVETFDVILWFHGGGMEHGSYQCKEAPGLAKQAIENGYAFVSVEYSMYPQARFPEFLLDAAQAVAYVIKHMGEHGGQRVIVTGQSAGAYLTMMLAMNPAYLRNAGADLSKVRAFVSDSAQMTVHFNVLRERGMDSRLERIDEAAPMYFAGVTKLEKPLMMISYTNDMECRLEQNRLMLRSLKRFQPEAAIELVVLEGRHCAGSTQTDADGHYPYIMHMLRFLEERG